ncbi:MAG: ABC transporter ATP-binding protein [Nanoarchaeota archaeon]|nr:ABC transporter ATP-binding protein [Nanoarchaeota archaeon]
MKSFKQGGKALSIKNLRKIYDNKFEALKGVDLDIEQGDFFALLGPNGAGKSTTIGIITSLVNKTSGSVKIHGVDIDEDFSKAKTFVGVVPQEFNMNWFEKVEDIILVQAGYYGIPLSEAKPRCEKLLKQLDLWDKRDDQARMLSGGMKRRLMIARAMIHNPKLLILDEPTAGVDIELRRSMWEFIKKLNKEEDITIILTTHYLEEAEELCKNIAIINKGEIVENTSMKKLLKKLETQSVTLDVKDELEKAPVIKEFEISLVDSTTIQVLLKKGQSLNSLIKALDALDIEVDSMRNTSNRLEELFLDITKSDKTKNEIGGETK